jgi:hypothetical protein
MFGSQTVLASLLLACACGGSAETSGADGADHGGGDSPACPTVTPCGGDVVGDWTLQQECIDFAPDAIAGLCPGATLGVSDLTVTGTVSFKADNTLTSSSNLSFRESVRFPTTCLNESQCAAYATALSATVSADSRIMGPHCAFDAATGCSCTMSASQSAMGSGTYQVQGTTLTITNASSAQPDVDGFCVAGNTLSIHQLNANGVSGGTLILTK